MEATPVRLRLLTRLSQKSHPVGSEVPLQVLKNVVVEGTVVVSQGTFAEGVVTSAKASDALGKGGGIAFEVPMIWSTKNQPIPIASSTTYATGRSNISGAIVAVEVFGTLGLLVRGGEAVIPAGSEYTMYVVKDRELYAE